MFADDNSEAHFCLPCSTVGSFPEVFCFSPISIVLAGIGVDGLGSDKGVMDHFGLRRGLSSYWLGDIPSNISKRTTKGNSDWGLT